MVLVRNIREEKGVAAAPGREGETRLHRHLKKWLEKAIQDFSMIGAGERVLVAVSGGADSLVLLRLLASPMVFTPPFEIVAAHIDLGFEGDGGAGRVLERHLAEGGYDFVLERTDYGPLAHSRENRKNPCFLCSRLRRRRLFEIAAERGCRVVALAHHWDDVIETLLINLFYGREISTMLPRQTIFAGEMAIVRPLFYIKEDLIKKYARECALPVTENPCPTSRTSRRAYIKDLIGRLEEENPLLRHNIWTALSHVKADYLPFGVRREG